MYRKLNLPSQQMDDGSVVYFDRMTEKTHVLNPTANRIYELCDKKDAEEIAQEFFENSDKSMAKEDILADITNTLTGFVENRLISKI